MGRVRRIAKRHLVVCNVSVHWLLWQQQPGDGSTLILGSRNGL